MRELSDVLEYLRSMGKMRNKDIAEVVGVSETTVIMWKGYLSVPTKKHLETLYKMCDIVAEHKDDICCHDRAKKVIYGNIGK